MFHRQMCWASLDIGVLLTTRVDTDLVHDGDASLLGSGVQLQHGRADVAGCDDMLLLADSRLDDLGMEGVGDQGDGEVVLGDSSVEGLYVVDIEGCRPGVRDSGGELLGGQEGPAGYRDAARPSRLAKGAEGRQAARPDERGTGLGECERRRGWDGPFR